MYDNETKSSMDANIKQKIRSRWSFNELEDISKIHTQNTAETRTWKIEEI